MAINAIYQKLTGNFTMSDNDIVRDATLSPEARLIYVLIRTEITKPNYTLSKETIFRLFSNGKGKDRFDKHWKELKNSGVLVMRQKHGENNQFCYEYELVDVASAQSQSIAEPNSVTVEPEPFTDSDPFAELDPFVASDSACTEPDPFTDLVTKSDPHFFAEPYPDFPDMETPVHENASTWQTPDYNTIIILRYVRLKYAILKYVKISLSLEMIMIIVTLI